MCQIRPWRTKKILRIVLTWATKCSRRLTRNAIIRGSLSRTCTCASDESSAWATPKKIRRVCIKSCNLYPSCPTRWRIKRCTPTLRILHPFWTRFFPNVTHNTKMIRSCCAPSPLGSQTVPRRTSRPTGNRRVDRHQCDPNIVSNFLSRPLIRTAQFKLRKWTSTFRISKLDSKLTLGGTLRPSKMSL